MPHVSSTRRRALLCFATGAASILLSGAARAGGRKMIVHKSATCGCCGKWTARMREAGYLVEEIVEADMSAVKTRLGVPKEMASCHTAEIDGYVVEGHVPARALDKMLTERPKAVGLAAPGMPAGSPSMEGGEAETYTLYLFGPDGARDFGKWVGDRPA